MYFHEDGGGYSAEKESSEGVRAHTSETLSQKHIHAYARAEWMHQNDRRSCGATYW